MLMMPDDFRAATLRVLGLAALMARWTPTQKDDATLELLLKLVEDDALWRQVCALLGVGKEGS